VVLRKSSAYFQSPIGGKKVETGSGLGSILSPGKGTESKNFEVVIMKGFPRRKGYKEIGSKRKEDLTSIRCNR